MTIDNINIKLNKSNLIDKLQLEKLNEVKKLGKIGNLTEEDKSKLDKVARGFEAIFLNMMIKEMRKSQLNAENEDSFGDDILMDYSNLLLAEQIANNNKGIGLVKELQK